MTKPLSLVLIFFGGLLGIFGTAAMAQNPEAPAPAAAGTMLEQNIKQIETIDQENARKTDTLRKVIDQGLLSKHITDTQAQSLRFGLRAMSASAGSEPLINAMSAANLKPENATLAVALKTFEAEWTVAQAERPALIKTACSELRTSVDVAVRTAKTVAEIDPLLAAIDRLESLVPIRNTSTTAALGANMLSVYANILRHVRKIVALQASSPPEPVALSTTLSQLMGMSSSLRGSIEESTLQQRVHDTMAPFQKIRDEAQEKVEALLLAGKPSAEVNAAVTKLEEATAGCPQVQSFAGNRDLTSLVAIYRSLAGMLALIEAGQTVQARKALSTMRSTSFQPLGPAKVSVFTKLIADWDRNIDESIAKAGAARREEVNTRLVGAKHPADLEALSADIFKYVAEAREREPDFPRNMPGQLNGLAAAWATSNPNLLRQQFPDDGDQRFATEMTELRRRVERDVIAGSLDAPELVQAPLAGKPLEEAIESLKGQLAKIGEWRRLLQIIEAQTGQTRTNVFAPPQDDLATSVRAYIAGQNMELAELWRDALQSYKTVLRCTSAYAPIKEAAESVKRLTKEHPEAVQAPAATPAPPAPPHVSPTPPAQ